MKKILLAIISIALVTGTKAQSKDEKKQTDWSKIDLSNRANDHFMIQYGADGWSNAPDSAKPSGFSRHFNFYFMYDKPFKSNPQYSVAIGLGLGYSNMFFENKYVDIKSNSERLPFTNVSASSTNHFDKYKLTTLFAEIPVELRFSKNPITPDKGIKASVGFKFGTILKSYTKGKNALGASGNSLYGDKYIVKESNKKFFNTTRIAATGRFGFGNISIDGSYQLTPLLKTSAGPRINPYSFGLTLSGL